MYNETFMRRAIELSAQAIGQSGAKPYGAVVAKDGRIIGEGLNRSTGHFDPTSHGEVEAIRDACRKLAALDLAGAELYTSCEPCPMCVATMMIAGIGRLYYGATADESDGIVPRPAHLRHTVVRPQIALPTQARAMPAERKLGDEAVAVLKQWMEKQAK